MKNIIKFLIFIMYSTFIFFVPNNKLVVIFIIINLFLMILIRKHFKYVINNTFKILPFIIFTFIINCLIDNIINALWIGIKLIIVCNATIIYSSTTNVTRNSKYNTITMCSIKDIQN